MWTACRTFGSGSPCRPARAEGWLGEIEGVDLTLQCLRDKRADALRLTRITRQVDLGMPAVGAAQ
jgi:hypothetical protein